MRRIPVLVAVALLATLAALAPPAAAQGGTFVECADFTPASVRNACLDAVPAACRGPEAPPDFNACVRANGTTPEAVRATLDRAFAAAGIPVGGVDAGFGGLAAEDAMGAASAWLFVALCLAGLALVASVRRRARRRRLALRHVRLRT